MLKRSVFVAAHRANNPASEYPPMMQGFTEYIKENNIKAKAVYLSLGDREEKTRNPVMATVGHAIRSVYETISDSGINTILEWNQGNHFKDVDISPIAVTVIANIPE